jgi:hypothetical protein
MEGGAHNVFKDRCLILAFTWRHEHKAKTLLGHSTNLAQYIREVLGSNLLRDTSYRDQLTKSFHAFPQSFQTNAGIMP